MNTFTLYHEPVGAGYTETDFDGENQHGTPQQTLEECKAMQARVAASYSNPVTWHIFEREAPYYDEGFTIRQYTLTPCLTEISNHGWRWECVYEYYGPPDREQ